ncbi:MAG: TlpA family protein disulfide reductase [Bacteroidales bacterium]|nr:TlpA family protein disulfide reductase [Bacteroidales bacterium]
MRNCSLLLLPALILAACSPKASIDCTLSQAPGASVEVRRLDLNTYQVLDTLKADASGRVRYKVDVQPGQPEFIYLFYKDTKIASLLLEAGDRVSVEADTLGNYSIKGSPESSSLQAGEQAYARFQHELDAETDPSKLARIYIDHYRAGVSYVMNNIKSLTVIPVLFEQLDMYTPVFNRHTDAIMFRMAVDSLKTVYPESRYVAALESETKRRESAMQMQTLVDNAKVLGFPDIVLPDINGERVPLSAVPAKAVLLHFWDSSDATHKMFNLDRLLPQWKRWHAKGFEIYAVDVNPDKSSWASIVKAQQLPWINVNDGRGAASALVMYNVESIPASFLLVDGGLSSASLAGDNGLEKELSRVLK